MEKLKKEGSGVICAFCGKEPLAGEVQGSIKHPCCKKCFKEKFDNDYSKYQEFMRSHHG